MRLPDPQAAIERVFDEAFGSTSGSPVRGDQLTDRVEYAPEGLRLSYSIPTAEWLTSVTERPHDFGLVYNFLVEEVLASNKHPLGRLTGEFVSLVGLLFSSGYDGRGGWSDESSGAAASPGVVDRRTPLAAQCMKIGVNRLHGLVGDVLPPLQQNPGRSFALAAVEAVLFERCGDVLGMLLSGALGQEDSAYEARLSELQALRPCHLGIREQFWLEEAGAARDGQSEATAL